MVVGLDPSTPAGIAYACAVGPDVLGGRLDALAVYFEHMRENLARTAPAVHRFSQGMAQFVAGMQADQAMSEYDAGSGMRWSPPADGEETPPCPA